MKTLDRLLLGSGLLIPVWLLVGYGSPLRPTLAMITCNRP